MAFILDPLHSPQTAPLSSTPKPSHEVHRPLFELNERSSGSILKNPVSQIGHDRLALNTSSFPESVRITTVPPPRESAFSIVSVSASLLIVLGLNLAITKSIY